MGVLLLFAGAALAQDSERRGSNPFSNAFNPAISANGLLLGTATTGAVDPAVAQPGLSVQELELQLLSNVDPYFSANLILAVPGGEGLELEEGYLTSIPKPLGISFRAGKIKLPLGRENPLHTHSLPFVDRSLMGLAILGEEGLSEMAVEGSALLPLPWYALLSVAVADGTHEELFASPRGRDLAGLAALKNVFELSEDSTLEAGLSGALGKDAELRTAAVAGAHLVYKWRPARDAASSSAEVTLEALASRRGGGEEEEPSFAETAGFYAFAQYQLARNWYAAARIEYLTRPGVESEVTTRESAILVLVPTEFSAFRLQVSATQPPGGAGPVLEAFLQANFTIGAHPAHAY